MTPQVNFSSFYASLRVVEYAPTNRQSQTDPLPNPGIKLPSGNTKTALDASLPPRAAKILQAA
jgi:hypothetical protein